LIHCLTTIFFDNIIVLCTPAYVHVRALELAYYGKVCSYWDFL
jgi:hypothetical protein